MKNLFNCVGMLTLMLANSLSLFSQTQSGEQYYLTKDKNDNITDITWHSPEKYIFLDQTAPHQPKSIFNSRTGWTDPGTFSDEFNDGLLDTGKWWTNYNWGNNNVGLIAYHKTSGNFLFPPAENNVKFLRMQTVKEYIENSISTDDKFKILNDGLPNFRPFYMTSAMLKRKVATPPYGYIELCCRITNSRFLISNFWLYGAKKETLNKETVNDMNFEIKNGRNCYLSSNFKEPNLPNIRHESNVITTDEPLSYKWDTLAFKWEPQRLTFYINNKIVKTVTQDIPNVAAEMIINLGQNYDASMFSDPGAASFPSFFDVNYVRTYQRLDTLLQPNYIDFTINEDDRSKGYVVENGPNYSLVPIQVYANEPILLNGNLPECFNYNRDPNGVYYLSVKECNNYGEPIVNGGYFSKWLTNEESKNIEKLDVNKFCINNDLQLNAGKFYRIKLATGGKVWTERVRVIKVNICKNIVDFAINGKTGSQCSIIEIEYNNKSKTQYDSEPMIMLDASKIVTCNDRYFFSIQKSDAYCNGIGTEYYTDNITASEIETYGKLEGITNFDVRSFVKDKWNFMIQNNNYYKIKMATGVNQTDWTDKTVIIHINQCNNNFDFLVNDKPINQGPIEIYGDDPNYGNSVLVSMNYLGACEDFYYVKAEEFNPNTNSYSPIGIKHNIFFGFKQKYQLYDNLLNLNDEYSFPGWNLFETIDKGKTYRITIGYDSPNSPPSSTKIAILHFNGMMCKPTVPAVNAYTELFIKSVALNNFIITTESDKGFKNGSKFCPYINTTGDRAREIDIDLTPRLTKGGVDFNTSIFHYWNVWVDLNEDNIFLASSDPTKNEKLWTTTSNTLTAKHCILFIPAATKLGKKRIRFQLVSGQISTNDACLAPYPNGEVEDYFISYENYPISQPSIGKALESNLLEDDISISELSKEEIITMFPNPTTGIINFYGLREGVNYKLEVYNSMGMKIRILQIKDCTKLDLTDVPNGFYLVNIFTEKGAIINKSIVISRE